MSKTLIVAILGIFGVSIFAFRSKLSKLFDKVTSISRSNQLDIEENAKIQKEQIKEQEKKIKELEEESKKAKKTINDIAKTGNEEAKKIIEENDADKLINEFNEW